MKRKYIAYIVESSQNDQKSYCNFLKENKQYEFQIIKCSSATQALERFKSLTPDLIILNFNLPDTTGVEFIEKIKQQIGKNNIPAIVLSEQGDERIAVQAMKSGAQDYLLKARLTSEALNRACHTVMERIHLMQQLEQQQEQQQLIAAMALRIRQFLQLEGVLITAVEEIRNFLKADRVLVYQFKPNIGGTIVAESVLPGWKSLLNLKLNDTYFCNYVANEYRNGKRFIATNIHEMDLSECHLEMLNDFQVQASLIVPILSCSCFEDVEAGSCFLTSDNPLWGLLVTHQCSSVRQWQVSEVDLLDQLSVQLAIAIQQAELYQNLQMLNTQLEAKVQERTVELRQSERKFRAIFEQTFQFIGLLSPDGIILELNQGALEFSGVKRNKIIGQPIWELPYCQNLSKTKPSLRKAITLARKGKFVRYEVQVANAEGIVKTIDFSIKPIFNEKGMVVLLLPEGRDITERKQTEEALQQLNQDLEFRVKQRTIDIEQTNAKLRKEIEERQRVELELRHSEAKFRQLAENISQVFFIFTLDYNELLYISPAYQQVWGRSCDSLYKNPQSWLEQVHTEDIDGLILAIQRQLQTEGMNYEYRIHRSNGEIRWIYTQTFLVRNEIGEVKRIIAIAEDITERKKAEVKMLQLQQRLEFLLASTPGTIYTSKASGDYSTTFISENARALFGHEDWEYTANSKFWLERIHPEDKYQVIARLENIFVQDSVDLEYRFLDKSQTYRWVYDQAKLIRDHRGTPVEIIGYRLEISDRKQAELEVIHNRDLREAIFNESTDAIFLVDGDTRLTIDCNRRAVELFEASSKEELLGIEGSNLQRYQFTDKEMQEIVEALKMQNFWCGELEYVSFRGNFFWGNFAFKQINVAGQEMSLVRVSDISDRKKSMEQIRRSLEEKETLLKEIHHRVKNNLQIISSLLRMQSRRPLDESTLILFQESQNRVQSMALIHEQLYQSPDLSQIDFGDYIRSLTDNLFRCYGVSQKAISLNIETNGLKLSLDTAIPCGLIINELVSNSLKYAFPKNQCGKISISLEKNVDNTVTLRVSDSGIGIPESIDWQNTNSLGLRIVHNLTRQLKGKINLACDYGTTFYINFAKISKS